MSVGKYSPTVSTWYAKDREWFEKNGGSCLVFDAAGNIVDYKSYDKDGYDRYGYHMDTDQDRAGYTEFDYLEDSNQSYHSSGYEGSPLYNQVDRDWSNIPAPTCDAVKKHEHEWAFVIG